jgi:hypothetical protein
MDPLVVILDIIIDNMGAGPVEPVTHDPVLNRVIAIDIYFGGTGDFDKKTHDDIVELLNDIIINSGTPFTPRR